jgi:hypothetical protein
MTAWQRLLRDGDPAAGARLTAPQAERMRRAVVAAAGEAQDEPFPWYRPLAMAALVVLMLGVGAAVGQRAEWADVPPPGTALLEDNSERRQLQFATPGGTRIIWVFNSEFEMRETMP